MDIAGLVLTLCLLYAGSSGLMEVRIYRRSPHAMKRMAKRAEAGFGLLLAAGLWRLVTLGIGSFFDPLPGGEAVQRHVYAPLGNLPAIMVGVGLMLLLAAFRDLLRKRGTGATPHDQ